MAGIVTNNCPPQLIGRNVWRPNDLSQPVRLFQNDLNGLQHGTDRASSCKLIVQTLCKGHLPAKIQGGIRDAAVDLAHTDHPNIAPVACVIEDAATTHVLFERPGGGCFAENLASSKEPLTERQAVSTVLAGAMAGLEELQKADLFLPCIMPCQLWMAAGECTQILVLLLPLLQPLAAAAAAGTPEELQYLAPELLRPLAQQDGKEYAASSSGQGHMAPSAADKACAWSLGVLAQKLCTHTLPYKGSSVQQLLAAITAGRGKASTPPPLWMSDQGKAFISAALQPDPAKRPKVSELLNHPWITALGFQPASPQERYSAAGLQPQFTRDETPDLLQAQGGSLSSPQDHNRSSPGGRPLVMVLPPPPLLQPLMPRSESPALKASPSRAATATVASSPTALRSPGTAKQSAAASATGGADAAAALVMPGVRGSKAQVQARSPAAAAASATKAAGPATGRWAAPLKINKTFHEIAAFTRSSSSDLEPLAVGGEGGRVLAPQLVQPRSAVLANERGKGGSGAAAGRLTSAKPGARVPAQRQGTSLNR